MTPKTRFARYYPLGLGELQRSGTPPGVSANDWVPMGEAVGFVIEHGDSHMNRPGVLRGYFAILRGDKWMRVDPNPEMAIRPAELAR